MSDWSAEPSAQRWIRHVIDEMVPKMRGSAFVTSLVPSDEGDVKFWVELGAAIMMGKPLVFVVLGDRELPPGLRRVADEIVRIPEGVDLAGSEKLAAAIKRVSDSLA